MTLPQFHAAIGGYLQAHAPKETADLDESDFLAALADEMAAGRA
ncbi:hypothetical protein [Methylobacterium sp. Leaf102]|nr:hypothetical protein [Methylobacterium sp. Leaf102]